MTRRQWLIVFLLISGLSGCFSAPFAESTWQVGEYRVTETIRRKDGFPDPVFERTIAVKDGLFSTRIGSYTDEASTGITVAPEIVGEWLVVYSSSHVFWWQPGEKARHFEPHRAEGWSEYAAQFGAFGLNGHYDYYAAHFWVEDDRWFLTCECVPGYCGDERPASITFVSEDEGENWRVAGDETVRRQRSGDSSQWAAVRRQWSVVSCQSSVVNGLRSAVYGQPHAARDT